MFVLLNFLYELICELKRLLLGVIVQLREVLINFKARDEVDDLFYPFLSTTLPLQGRNSWCSERLPLRANHTDSSDFV